MTYLDAASSEPLHPAAREVLLAAVDQGYADPRRLHREARSARLMLENARAVTAECLGVRADEVTFVSSGTHAVHTGLLGLLGGVRRNGLRNTGPVQLVHPAVEHSAVLHAASWHQSRGGRATSVPVDTAGRVSVDDLVSEAEGGADVVALQSANHEVGTLQPVSETGEAAAAYGVPVFTDACASMGRLPLPTGWSVAAGSAHKWGGPAGVGVLLVRKGVRWRNPWPADDRVDPRGAGFENVPAVLAAAAALRAVTEEATETGARQHAMIERLRRAAAAVPDTEVVGDPVRRLPHLLTFSCLYVDGEALVDELDRRGFAIASGSACTASTLEPSHVLAAMGALTHGNVRLSLGRDTTPDEVERFCAVLPDVVAGLRAELGAP